MTNVRVEKSNTVYTVQLDYAVTKSLVECRDTYFWDGESDLWTQDVQYWDMTTPVYYVAIDTKGIAVVRKTFIDEELGETIMDSPGCYGSYYNLGNLFKTTTDAEKVAEYVNKLLGEYGSTQSGKVGKTCYFVRTPRTNCGNCFEVTIEEIPSTYRDAQNRNSFITLEEAEKLAVKLQELFNSFDLIEE